MMSLIHFLLTGGFAGVSPTVLLGVPPDHMMHLRQMHRAFMEEKMWKAKRASRCDAEQEREAA